MLGLFVGLIGFAPSAFAHHPEISASTGCADGKHKVSYKATSWADTSSSQGRHSNIQISYSLNGGAFQYHATGAFTPANDGSFSGSISLPLSTTGSIVVKATDVGPWENGAAGGNPRQTGSLPLKTNCAPPADPSATASVDCPNDEIDIALTGKDAATTVDIFKNGLKVENDHPVPVGSSSTSVELTDDDENTTVVIKLDYAVGTDQTLNVHVDCDSPATPTASISWECGENAIVRLKNTGGEPVTATITRKGTAVHTNVAVAPGADFTLPVTISAADEDTDVVIKVTFSDSGTSTDLTKTVEVDCQTPAPVVGSPVCAADGILIPLSNTGTQSVTFTVASPVLGQVPVDLVVLAGGNSSITLPVAEDATTTVSIKVGVQEIYGNQALKRDCEKPAATVTFECAAGGVVVKLTNAGPNAAIVPVDGENVTVPGNTTTPITRTIEVAEGQAYDITVLGQQAKSTRDCEKPAATVDFTCAAGGVTVVLSNTGELPTTIKVNGTDHEIAAGGSKSFVVPVAEGDDYDVTVTGDGLNKSAKGTRDCENPASTVKFDCAAEGVVVELTNDGQSETKVDVDGETVTVPAGTTSANPVTRTIEVAEGVAYDITVLGQQAKGTRDCEKPAATVDFTCAVGGVTAVLSNTGELPTTIKVNIDSYVIQPGATQTITIPVVEGADYDVTVTGDDNLNKQAKGTRDCEQPVVTSADLVCAEGGVVVELTNTGERDTLVNVGGTNVTVPKNGTASHTVEVLEGAAYSVKITGDGINQAVTGTRDCENPAVVSADVVCAEDGVVVELSNPTGANTIVKVNGEDVEVPAGTTADNPVRKVVPVTENAPYSITVVGDELDETITGIRNCEQPEVEATQVACAEGGVQVTLSNSGESDTTVTVDGNPVLVPSDSTVTVLVPVAENAAYDFTVEGDELSQKVTGTLDCLVPETVVDEVVCADGGLNTVLRNTGTDAGTFLITSPALPGGELEKTLAAGTDESVLIPLAEGASTTVRVTSADEVLYDSTVTRSCEQVRGVQVTPASQVQAQNLPRTGGDTGGLLTAGLALLLAGLALVAGSARRRSLDV